MTEDPSGKSTDSPGGYPAPGQIVDGKYRVDALIGEGAMGAVVKATHLVRRAPVALKFMNAAVMAIPGAVRRFENEAVAASKIESDHIVRLHDTGTLPNGVPFLVMEHLEGHDLERLIAREGASGLPIPRAIHITLQILRALQVAHAAGVVHRDMKPANCFIITKDAEPDFIKLLDFGISKVHEPQSIAITQSNVALGTPLYMSPEQARSPRDVDYRSDLYSTGVILYELLTGTTPVDPHGAVTEVLYQLFVTEVPSIKSRRPDLPDELAAAVHHALEREPNARVASAAAMAESLARWADPRSATVLAKIRTRAAISAIAPPISVNVVSSGVESLPQPFAATALAKPPAVRTDLSLTPDGASVGKSSLPPARSSTLRSIGLWVLGTLVLMVFVAFWRNYAGVKPLPTPEMSASPAPSGSVAERPSVPASAAPPAASSAALVESAAAPAPMPAHSETVPKPPASSPGRLRRDRPGDINIMR